MTASDDTTHVTSFDLHDKNALDFQEERNLTSFNLPNLLKSFFDFPSAPSTSTAAANRSASATSRSSPIKADTKSPPKVQNVSVSNVSASEVERAESVVTKASRSSSKARERDNSSKAPEGYVRPFRFSTRGTASVSVQGDLAASLSHSQSRSAAPAARAMPLSHSSSFSTYNNSISDISGSPNSQSIAHNFSNIPGFPLSKEIVQDDVRSVSSVNGIGPAAKSGVSMIFRRLRGEGLSQNYWMPDETAKQVSVVLPVQLPSPIL